ncbi:MAG: hypothetical protein K6A43_10715 [Treponema sp.]|nr:hypothetical protein [Treponema sp.]
MVAKMQNGNYDDIINTQWTQDSLKNRMPVSQRAKIFLPFAALTGYEDELDKTLAKEIESMQQRTGQIKFYEDAPKNVESPPRTNVVCPHSSSPH